MTDDYLIELYGYLLDQEKAGKIELVKKCWIADDKFHVEEKDVFWQRKLYTILKNECKLSYFEEKRHEQIIKLREYLKSSELQKYLDENFPEILKDFKDSRR